MVVDAPKVAVPPTFNGSTATPVDWQNEYAKLKRDLAEATKELEAARTYKTQAEEKYKAAKAEAEQRKRVLTILTESKKLDAKKLAAVEKFVAEFYAD